ncbi:hypothetical protein ACFQ58_02515 [Agromyces sp. NPDC056523]|uniref:hypothetical protein n=1 Tax=Agromyces sp. NPDC056523 TaxID=3345850 RepID=UPI0036732F80
MLEPFVQEAVVDLADGSEPAALGAAVTITLCGSVDHEPPCPLAPHFSRTELVGGRVRLRVLFVTEPEHEAHVRALIRSALERGSVRTPDGSAEWALLEIGARPVAENEVGHAARLAVAD